mmetsp:Transcript_83676/g.159757  ORF Transcript_83676/g.159757 Transcript_83676/m.159757 type:complete len:594 (-) Transcript_83676:48-1829(-)
MVSFGMLGICICLSNLHSTMSNSNRLEESSEESVNGPIPCHYKYHEFDQKPMAYLLFSPNAQQFDAYQGIDMLPKRHFELVQSPWPPFFGNDISHIWERGKNGPPHQSETIQMGHCSVVQEDGGAWLFARVGPFYSTGNVDWWHAGMRDVFLLSNLFPEHPDGVYFTKTLLAPTQDNGEILGYPPIHLHHVAVQIQPYSTMKGLSQIIFGKVIHREGDCQCLPMDGGTGCLLEELGVQEIDRVVDLDTILCDVRDHDSQILKWWFDIRMRWHPKSYSQIQPISNIFLQSNESGYGTSYPAQLSQFFTMSMNTTTHGIVFISGRMYHGGQAVRLRLHTHQIMLDRSFVFRAEPQELGLVGGSHEFPSNADAYTFLSDTGFSNFDEVQVYLMDNLAAAAREHDNTCLPSSSPWAGCDFNRPFMICKALQNVEEVYDEKVHLPFPFDRQSKYNCNQWSFKQGEIWTTVTLFKPITKLLNPNALAIPKIYPEHAIWRMDFQMSSPPLNGKATYRKRHGYYIQQLANDVSKDVWDYLLRLPPSFFLPGIYMSGTQNLSCLSIMKYAHWPDALYDGPNDYPNLIESGAYSKYVDVGRYL